MDLGACDLCPRACMADRLQGKHGVCGVSGEGVYLARAALHFYEEPCISGTRGSGAVFFSGCSLHCIYCQNADIAAMRIGKEVSTARLARIFLELQEQGAHNINLVTPTHYAVQIAEALRLAKADGLRIPIVYNCSGYEGLEALSGLKDLIDIYLTDFKYMDPALAKAFSAAEDYPERAAAALSAMYEAQPEAVFDADGIMQKGIIVRHLLLPGHVKNAKAVVRYVYARYGDAVFFSLMNQYTPMRELPRFTELNRKVTRREYARLVDYALELGIQNAFIQEGSTAAKSFIPAFDYEGVLGKS